MSKLYGTLKGAAKNSRTVRGDTFLTASAQSYEGSIIVNLRVEDGSIVYEVGIAKGSSTLIKVVLLHGSMADIVKMINS